MKCKNCDNEFNGKYCNECGQKVIDRLTIKGLWNLIIDDIFEINKGLLYTLKRLWTNPGETSLDFINGRTKRYYSPLKYLIFWTAIYFILSSLVGLKNQTSKSLQTLIFNSSKPFSSESFEDFGFIYLEAMGRHLDFFYFGMILFLTITSYFIYKKKGYYFTELSILYVYILGQLVFLLIATILVVDLFGKNISLYMIIPEIALVLYLIIKSHKEFFRESWTKTILKSIAVLYIGQILYGVTAYLLVSLVKILKLD